MAELAELRLFFANLSKEFLHYKPSAIETRSFRLLVLASRSALKFAMTARKQASASDLIRRILPGLSLQGSEFRNQHPVYNRNHSFSWWQQATLKCSELMLSQGANLCAAKMTATLKYLKGWRRAGSLYSESLHIYCNGEKDILPIHICLPWDTHCRRGHRQES